MAWQWWDDFDKMMCGKWISEQFEINGNYVRTFLHIEQAEAEVIVKFDFDSDDFNNSAFYVEYSYNSLYFFHNDREHRAKYVLTMENNDLMKCKFSVMNCWGYKGKFEKDIDFTRLEALSEEEYKKYASSNKVKPKDASKKVDILKEYAEYGDIKSDVKFEFKFDERGNMLDIIEKYNLDELVKGKNDVEKAITLMHWLCARYRHGNPPGHWEAATPQALMEFADKSEGRINCRCLALILAQLIRAYHIKALHVTCSPYENPFDDCHVVVCVYCESLGKYIMLDPSCNLYLKNEAGKIIGAKEFRDILVADGELFYNEEATNWGYVSMTDSCSFNEYRDYMAKNFIRLERYNLNAYGKDGGEHVILIPEKYMQNEAKNFDESIRKNFITSREYFWEI